MTDTIYLNRVIKESGLRKGFISESVGLSYQGLWNKINGKREFTGTEIMKLSKVLHLSAKERDAIFFADKVEKSST